MGLRDTFLNMLGGNSPIEKQNNALRSARDFLINGNRDKLYPSWSDIKMPDSDMYRGYSYAVIQKRGNKVATLAKNNLKTWANPEIVDEYQKKKEQVFHPYLKVIEDSADFTEKQFWKNISIYLDLAGRYYLGVVRNEIKPLNPNLPTITTDPTKFIMLNPYEIRRVIDKDGNVAGYIERKKDGRYREWPKHQIIEMRELNPFDPENSQWAMTDAAKNAVYTINQSGDYTRQSLNGNIEAPGIITTDVLLSDEDFANFRARLTQHAKGEPLFGNGAGAIKWDSMQIDLDKAALLDINEINRTELFAVSGTSKTSLGIEQSGTTRETARVQSEQFVSDTAQPRLEDIVDFLNLDYKRHYVNEYKRTGYKIEVESTIAKDYETEQKATELKQTQFGLAMQLIQSGYSMQSAYQFAEGLIGFEDLELEKGINKPINPQAPEQGDNPDDGNDDGNGPNPSNNGPRSDSEAEDDEDTVSEENSLEKADFSELEPHSDLIENGGKGSGHFGHSGRAGQVGGSSKGGSVTHREYSSDGKNVVAQWEETKHPVYPDSIIVKTDEMIGMNPKVSDDASVSKTAYNVRDKKLKNPFDVFEPIDEKEEKYVKDYLKATFDLDDDELEKLLKVKNSVEGKKSLPLDETGCCHDHKVETIFNAVEEDEGKVAEEKYSQFLEEIRDIEKQTIEACIRKVDINAFEESDIIGPRKKKSLTELLKNAIHKYWWSVFPLFANNFMNKRNTQYGEDVNFIFNNDLQASVDDNAKRVAEGHMKTILNDVLDASNKAYSDIREQAAAELIIKAYKVTPEKFEDYFEYEPTMADALESIRKTDILEVNRKIYEKANKMAFEGYSRRDIVKAIREEYSDISKERATFIAQNETSRAFTHSQYEADKQFLNSVGKLENAYKQLVSSRPASEQDKICPVCQAIINKGPIPFETPFLAYGEDIEVLDEKGRVKIFTANYEDINGGVVHPRCFCRYELVFKNDAGEFTKTLNGGDGSGNFGHAGRPGEVGGSAPENKSASKPESEVDGYNVTYSDSSYLDTKEYEELTDYCSDKNLSEEDMKKIGSYVRCPGLSGELNQSRYQYNSSDAYHDAGKIEERKSVLIPESENDFTTVGEELDKIKEISEKLNDYKKRESEEGISIEERKAIIKEFNEYYTANSDYIEYADNYDKGYYDGLDRNTKIIKTDKQAITLEKAKKLYDKDSKKFEEYSTYKGLSLNVAYSKEPIFDGTKNYANRVIEGFKDLDELDKIITTKGYKLEHDITVTRRVSNQKVISNDIAEKGYYEQPGLTSTTAKKTIAQKMPSGISMGDELIRITIPAGTRVLSTWKSFLTTTGYEAGIKNQSEIILPSKTKFISANGEKSMKKNEDGTWQAIAITKQYEEEYGK